MISNLNIIIIIIKSQAHQYIIYVSFPQDRYHLGPTMTRLKHFHRFLLSQPTFLRPENPRAWSGRAIWCGGWSCAIPPPWLDYPDLNDAPAAGVHRRAIASAPHKRPLRADAAAHLHCCDHGKISRSRYRRSRPPSPRHRARAPTWDAPGRTATRRGACGGLALALPGAVRSSCRAVVSEAGARRTPRPRPPLEFPTR